MYKKIVSSSLVAGVLLAMNGCGGGSSSSDIITSSVEKAVLSGVAVDDLILNGAVQAKDTAANLLTEGRTGATDGRYTLNVAHTGVVLLNVTCDESSTMYNPVTAITTACGSDVNLNSITTISEAGQEVTVNISPLTEIVYQRALAEAGDSISAITEDDFDTARAEIGVMLGLDPIADNPLEDTYADIIDVIHTMAEESGTSVMEVTDALAEALADGSADGEDIIMDFVAAMDEVNIINNLVENNGTYTPPENPAQLSDIDAAKALFTELRTQAMSITDYTNSGTPGFLDTEAQAMDAALNDVTMNIGYMGDVLNVLADAIGTIEEQNLPTLSGTPMGPDREFKIDKTVPGAYSYTITEGSTTWNGTVSIPSVLLGDEAEVYTDGTLTMTVDGTVPLDYEAVAEAGVTDSQSFNGTLIVTKTTSGANIALNGEVSSNGTTITLTEANAELAYTESPADEFGDTEPVLEYFKLNSITMQGIVAGYTIDGSLTVNSYAQNTLLAPKGGFEEIAESSFGAVVACPTSSVASSNLSFSYEGVTYQADYVDEYYEHNYGFYALPIDVDYNTIQNNIDYTGTCTDTSEESYMYVNYSWSDSQMDIANSGWLPNDITFAGAISRTGASIEGTLNAKWLNAATMDLESDTEIPFVDVTLNGKLQMPERPEMLMTLSFENSATQNILGASYTYGTTVINAQGVFDTGMNNGDVAITTHTGLRADIKISDSSEDLIVYGGVSTVTKDGLLIGNFEDREGLPVVKYIDGSFESIF